MGHRSIAVRHLLASTALALAAPAVAQTEGDVAAQLESLRGELAAQRTLIADQQRVIERQQREIDRLSEWADIDRFLANMRARGIPQQDQSGSVSAPVGAPVTTALPDRPVGEAPPQRETEARARVEAVPEGQGVLTPRGRLVFDPQFEYVNASTNRLVFRGIELIPGIQIGLIEASDADRDTLVGTAAVRYGLTNRLEAELRVPYLYRHDRIEVVQQRDEGIVRQIELEDNAFGDIEFGLRYQLNPPRPLHPIWVASLRVKSNTGIGPFDIGYDEFGVATGLATGSGFWAIQPGISFLLPSDPVVIYGGASFLWHLPADVNRDVGGAFVGRVDPGDAISANLGFGFALNPRFSFSLGYRHSYLFPSSTEIGDTVQRSKHIQVGSLAFGMSYRVTERETINVGFNFGVTEDAPDLSISLRMPIDFGAPVGD
jgi:hypothetical protein